MSKNNEAADVQWWVVALSEEVVAGKPLAVMCDSKEYVLFRDATGSVRALVDQCAHRRAPLSLGHVTADGWIECPYHGWRFDGVSGGCKAIPNLSAQETVPPTYTVAAFAVLERDGFIQLCPQGTAANPVLAQTLALDAGTHHWQGAKLLAYPQEALLDLLIDAPGLVLDIPSITIVDDHRYGDPEIEEGAVVVQHAALWTPRRKSATRVVADYPLAVRVALTAAHTARVDVHTDAGELLASAWLAVTPVKSTLTDLRWRGTSIAQGSRLIEIGVREQLQPEAIKAVNAYPSLIRREMRVPQSAPAA